MKLKWSGLIIMQHIGTARYTSFGFIAILLWSTTVAMFRSITEQLGMFTAICLVCLISGIVSLSIFCRSGNILAKFTALSKRYMFCCGTLFLLYFATFFPAVKLAGNRSQTLEIGLINYLWPFFTISFSLFFLNKKARLILIPATLLVIAGFFLIVNQKGGVSWQNFIVNLTHNPLAYSLAMTAAISWGLYSVLTRRFVGPDGDGTVSFFLLVAGLIFLLVRFLRVEQSAWNIRVLLEVLIMSVATGLSYVCWEAAMRKGNVVLLAACSYSIPFLSTLFSCIYLRVGAGLNLWIGCFFIAAGAFISWLSVSERITPVNIVKEGTDNENS